MSLSIKDRATSLIVLLLGLLLLASQVACSPAQRDGALRFGEAFSQEIDKSLEEPSDLVLAGQVADENGRWLNDCVVVLFQNEEEVARTTSHMMNSAYSNQGPMDGVFELRIPNSYELTLAHEFYYSNDQLIQTMTTTPGFVGTRDIGQWFENLNMEDLRVIQIPDKQLEYTLVVLPYAYDDLPENFAKGNLSLDGKRLIVAPEIHEDENPPAQETAVPNNADVLATANLQIRILPGFTEGLAWNKEIKGLTGSRQDVWHQFVIDQGVAMSLEAFEYSVVVHNPHLEANGFLFYPDQTYVLPMNN